MLIPEPVPVAKEVGFTDWLSLCDALPGGEQCESSLPQLEGAGDGGSGVASQSQTWGCFHTGGGEQIPDRQTFLQNP